VIALLALAARRKNRPPPTPADHSAGRRSLELAHQPGSEQYREQPLAAFIWRQPGEDRSQGLANETNLVRGPQVTVEQQVASNLTLTYSTNVSVSPSRSFSGIQCSRNISIVALRDQNGVVSFDFRIRRRRK